MGKKRLGEIFKKTLAGVLSATMVLGMTVTGTVNTKAEAPNVFDIAGFGETALGPREAHVVTTSRTEEGKNSVAFGAPTTYIGGYIETGSVISYSAGLRLDVTFDREMKYAEEVEDPDTDEWFEFVMGNSVSAIDIDGDGVKESQCGQILDSCYDTDDYKTYDYIITDSLYNTTRESLKEKFGTSKKPAAFIICIHNIQSDIGVTFKQGGANEYAIADDYTTPKVSYASGAISVDNAKIEVKRYHVNFDTKTNKDKLTVAKDFTVTTPANQTIVDAEEPKIDSSMGITPAITTEGAGYEVEGWYSDEACTKKFDTTQALSDALMTSDSNADGIKDTLTLYAKYTAKDTANLTVHCYEEGTTTDVRPTADQNKLNKTGLTFGTTESITAPTITGYTLKAGTTTPVNATIDSLNKEVTFYYTANKDTHYTIRVHKTKLDNAAQTESYEGGEVQDIVMANGVSGKSLTIDPANIQEVKDATVGFKFDSANAGNNLTETVAADGSTVYNVYYNRNKYKVTFDTQTKAPSGATASTVGEKELFYGTTLTGEKKPSDPTLTGADGYEFKEWQTKSGATYTPWNLDTDTVEGNMTLYADYAEKANISYTICYYNKNTSAKIAEDKIVGNQIFNSVVTITPDLLPGYAYDSSNETNLNAVKLDAVGKVINLYYVGNAKNYSIETYKQNTAGTGFDKDTTLTKTIAAKIGDEIAAITPAAVAGFTFDSENANNVLSGTVPVTGNLILKVYYTRNKVAITFNPDGNKPDPAAEIDTSKLDPDKLTQDIPYETSPENPGTLSTEGYDFDGWSTDGTTPFTPGTDKLMKDETLVPIWTAKSDVSYTVNYYLDGTTTKVPGITPNPKEVTGKTYNTEVTENAPAVVGYTAKAPTSTKIKLNGYDKTITFYYTANNATYQVERYEMNMNGNYAGVSPSTTEKSAKVGETVNAEIAAATAEFTHDEAAAGKVESGVIPATDKLVLKVYYKRNQYKVSFNVTDGKSIPAGVTVSPVADETIYYGAAATKPADPKITGAKDQNFAGWYTDPEGTTPYNWSTPVSGTTTIYAKLEKKAIAIQFDDDAYNSIAYREFPIGGLNPTVGSADRRGGQLNFTLTVDGVSLDTMNYDSYTAEQKAMLDSVTFESKMIAGFENVTERNAEGQKLRAADIAAGGMASARYSGIQEVTASYLGYKSDDTVTIIVPGDTDANGTIAVGDLSNMAQYVRGKATASSFGSTGAYITVLADMDRNGTVLVGDISIAAQMVRDKCTYDNRFFK